MFVFFNGTSSIWISVICVAFMKQKVISSSKLRWVNTHKLTGKINWSLYFFKGSLYREKAQSKFLKKLNCFETNC